MWLTLVNTSFQEKICTASYTYHPNFVWLAKRFSSRVQEKPLKPRLKSLLKRALCDTKKRTSGKIIFEHLVEQIKKKSSRRCVRPLTYQSRIVVGTKYYICPSTLSMSTKSFFLFLVINVNSLYRRLITLIKTLDNLSTEEFISGDLSARKIYLSDR